MGLFFNRGTCSRPLYEFDVAAAFENMNALHAKRQQDHEQAKATGEQQRQRSIAVIRSRALELGETTERAATILLRAYPHASRADTEYQSGKPPFQLNASMPFRDEIAVVLHLAIQQAVVVITKEKGRLCYDLRREIETLLLSAHSALV
jgi:hypothetical protein